MKVDAKTKTLLDEYRKKKGAKEAGNESEQDKNKEKDKAKENAKDADSKENGDKGDKGDKEEGEESASEGGEELDENSKREDRVAQAGLEAIMREYAFELAKEPPVPKSCKCSCRGWLRRNGRRKLADLPSPTHFALFFV